MAVTTYNAVVTSFFHMLLEYHIFLTSLSELAPLFTVCVFLQSENICGAPGGSWWYSREQRIQTPLAWGAPWCSCFAVVTIWHAVPCAGRFIFCLHWNDTGHSVGSETLLFLPPAPRCPKRSPGRDWLFFSFNEDLESDAYVFFFFFF